MFIYFMLLFIKKVLFYIGLELTNSACQLQVYSKVTQLHIYMQLFFFKFFSYLRCYKVLSSFLCYTVGFCWLSILNIAVCTCQSQTPNLSILVTIISFPKSVKVFLLLRVHLYHFFLDFTFISLLYLFKDTKYQWA